MKLSLMIDCIHSIEVMCKDGRWLRNFGKHQRLTFVFSLMLIWFCKTGKLSESVLSSFKKLLNTNHQPYLH